MYRQARLLFLILLMQGVPRSTVAQSFNFNTGPIPPCDTSTFTSAVSGIGYLVEPYGYNTGYSLDDLWINITSEHPWTLKITVTSPSGTTVLLSAFNGAGGQNYTDTHFNGWINNITTGSAPFTGYFVPQDGNDIPTAFVGENANGTWVLTVIDTACAGGVINGVPQPDSTSTPGTFAGTGGGGMAFGYNDGWEPTCFIDLGSPTVYLCPGETFDLQAYAEQAIGLGNVPAEYMDQMTWGPVNDPTSVGSGYFSFSYTGDFGGYTCTAGGSVSVGEVQLDPLGPDLVITQCDNGPVNLRALFPGLSNDTWTLDGQYISSYSAAAAVNSGLYRVIVQASSNCPDTAWVTLNLNSDLLGDDETLSICPGSSTNLTLLYPNTGYTESWFLDGASIPAPTAATDSGTYMLVANSTAGCSDTASVTLELLPTMDLGQDQAATLCNNAAMDLTTLFTSTNLTTSWSLGGSPVALPEAITEPGTYQIAAVNAEGCTDSALVTVAMVVPPQLGDDVAANLCEGSTLDLASEFNTTGLTVAWTSAGMPVADPASVSTPGAYSLVATNSAGCSDTAQVVVTISPNPVLGADQSITACTGQAVNLGSHYATAPHMSTWTVNNLPVPDPSAVTSAGSYVLTVTSAAGCTSTANVELVFVPAPNLGADMSLTTCADSMIDLTSLYPTGGLTASWSVNGAAVTYVSGVGLPGTYQLVVSNDACTDTAWVVLHVDPNPSLGPDQSFALCPWRTVDLGTLFPTDGLSTTFALNGMSVANPDSVHGAGVYAVTATNAAGCSAVAHAIITNVDCLCEADLLTDADCMQNPAQFTLVADSTVQAAHWDFGGAAPASTQLNPEVHFEAGQDVVVTLQATLSCGVVTVERIVHVEDCSQSCHLWFPNSFTPDKDDKNDSWTWQGECIPTAYLLQIFDRWGELIFSTTDPYSEWDGTYRGSASPIGVYVYKAEYQLPYQDGQTAIGHVTLVR